MTFQSQINKQNLKFKKKRIKKKWKIDADQEVRVYKLSNTD